MNIAQGGLVALLAFPIIEIYLILRLGGVLGFLPTLALLIGAASLGAYLLQTQGWSTWIRVQQGLARGELPAAELVDGVVILAGGALLLLPGFLSDIAGLLCLLPFTRRLIAAWLIRNRFGINGVPTQTSAESKTIEGEFRRED